LTICDHLVSFLENCISGQCVPTKPAEYSVKIFAVIDVTDGFMYRACAAVQSQEQEGQESCSKCLKCVCPGHTDIKYVPYLHEREEICTLLKICRRKIKGNKEVFAAV
jgi:hypothetical protein